MGSGICNSNLPIHSFLLQLFIENLSCDRISARCQGFRGEQDGQQFARVYVLVTLLQHQPHFNLEIRYKQESTVTFVHIKLLPSYLILPASKRQHMNDGQHDNNKKGGSQRIVTCYCVPALSIDSCYPHTAHKNLQERWRWHTFSFPTRDTAMFLPNTLVQIPYDKQLSL